MSVTTQPYDLCAEIRKISSEFEEVVAPLRAAPGRGRRDRGLTPRNISISLPYLLIETFTFDRDLEAARAIARANAFGAAHFLSQDAIIDGDDAASPRAAAVHDTCLLRFFLRYSSIFPAGSPFWELAESYVREYFDSLAWERERLWGDGGADLVTTEALPSTLDVLGRKMSPLKCATAAISMLSERPDLIDKGSRLIEHYHAAYQLVDDLSDLGGDAARDRWSVPLRLLERDGRVGRPLSELGHKALLDGLVTSGVYDRVVCLIGERYEKAIALALELGLQSLADHVRRALIMAAEGALWVSRRATLARKSESRAEVRGRSAPDRILAAHSFSVGDRAFVVDPSSCLFFEADEVAADVLSWLRDGSRDPGLRVLEFNHGARAVNEAVSELSVVAPPPSVAASPPFVACAQTPEPSNIAALALNITSGCNLACDYCYLRREYPPVGKAMPLDVARLGVELLLDEAVGERGASLVFFGGEPLLERERVLQVAGFARELAHCRGVPLRMHITTNGTLLDRDTASRLDDLGVLVLVSIDGPASVQDRHRRFKEGDGSHSAVAANVAALPSGMSVSARVTLTPESAPLVETVEHLQDMGFRRVDLSPVSGDAMPPDFTRRLTVEFEELARTELARISSGEEPLVGNFLRTMRAVAEGRPRREPCGAGCRYLCMTHDGTLYFCHRFAGLEEFAVGSVSSGIDRRAIGRLLSRARERSVECASCWARFLCGGPCHYDVRTPEEDADDTPRCDVLKRVFELSMWMYASLSDDAKRELLGPGSGVEEGR